MSVLEITREQAVAYRLRVNHLVERLPPASYEEAAYVGLQDTAPRDALLGLHARVADCEPDTWKHPSLVQTYSPRWAVYVLPWKDFGVFTLGRLPLAAEAVRRIDKLADRVCRTLDGRELRGGVPHVRDACASGRIALRWTTSALWVREVPRPDVNVDEARKELCRRHVSRFAPTSPKTFAWWAGLSPADARQIWKSITPELLEVDFDGTAAWILQADEACIREAPRPRGIRLLVEPDLRLLGRDRDGRFIGPGKRAMTPAADSFHPNGVLVDGRIVGAWGRKGGRVHVILTEQLTAPQYDALAAEASAFPIPGAHLSLEKQS
ncbi:winged helix DNA-binding protein [Kribbella antiqua]|uniref:Winged helix DNA-binding protein n=1 Tax=Kribbella antiqua TaxID=2512217 RepID=A0A4R2IP07_9ACTN|nr:crosslink repair DNA glycosylase YcaQ family protein [Kribbella antiqua]TCO47011.1 winged helix DNA-binding protein [Kribbella antiqua]